LASSSWYFMMCLLKRRLEFTMTFALFDACYRVLLATWLLDMRESGEGVRRNVLRIIKHPALLAGVGFLLGFDRIACGIDGR
jgi:hypothetical protein